MTLTRVQTGSEDEYRYNVHDSNGARLGWVVRWAGSRTWRGYILRQHYRDNGRLVRHACGLCIIAKARTREEAAIEVEICSRQH